MHEAQDILSCIGSSQVLQKLVAKRNLPNQYFKSVEEMQELFADLPEALENSVNIAKKCHIMAFENKTCFC